MLDITDTTLGAFAVFYVLLGLTNYVENLQQTLVPRPSTAAKLSYNKH